ncbi:hypothetical protein [Flavobacterium sp.]|uniref:hypothetical protein n=1 Tax=Flavobacterium sp. TaxID=239 RepID=UPI0037516853
MKINRLLLLVSLLSFAFSQAQLFAFINGKEVKSGATISKKDLASLQISFKNPKKITVISGASVLYVDLLNTKKRSIQQWFVQKEGYIAIEDFLKTTTAQKKFKVFGEGEFPQRGNTLDWIMTAANGREEEKTIQVKVGFYVVQETGYREYGPQVQLLEPLVFNVTIWDTKNLFLPYLDLTIDKTNIPGDIDLEQSGKLGEKGTELGYVIKDQNLQYVSIYALDSNDYPGLNPKELANDFIHEGVSVANKGNKVNFNDYDSNKYEFPWDNINGLDISSTNLFRLSNLSYKVNKELKKMDMMNLFQSVEFNKLKGYTFKDDVDIRSNINSNDWRKVGKFQTYILNHPNNPNLTLIVSSNIYGNGKTAEEIDSFLKLIISSIKQ